jgi:hypothetical protein
VAVFHGILGPRLGWAAVNGIAPELQQRVSTQ